MKKTSIISQEEINIINTYVKNKSATLAFASEKLGYTVDELKEKLIKFGYRIRKKDMSEIKEGSEQKQISINFPMEHSEAKEAYDYIMALYPVERSRWVRKCLYIGIKLSNKFGPSWTQEGSNLIDGRLSIQDEIRQLKKDILNSLKNVRIIDNDGQEKEAKEIVSELDLGDLEF